MNSVTVSRRDDRLIAIKRASPDDRDRRQREARTLTRLDHPGIVKIIEFIDGDPVELVMEYTGTDSWQRNPPATRATIIDGLAAVASTVADLHDLGTAHLALRAEHVLVSSARRPVLCGFADAGTADGPNRAEDTAGLAALIDDLCTGAPIDLRSDLDRLAAEARTGALTARDLGDELLALRSPEPRPRRVRWPSPLRASIPIAIAIAIIGAVIISLWAGRPDTEPAAAIPTDTEPPTTAPLATPTLRLPAPSVPPPPNTDPTAAESTLTIDDMLIIVHEGRRFGVGQNGDISILGDWNCDGTPTPALLQTRLGRVAIFPAWPEPNGSLDPTATMRVAGATDLQRVDVDGCDQLRIIYPRGSTLFTPELP
jgi:serine/threonine protein kinase